MVGNRQEAAKVYPALVALATESMDQEKREPGVALHALEVLAFEDSANAELPALLERPLHLIVALGALGRPRVGRRLCRWGSSRRWAAERQAPQGGIEGPRSKRLPDPVEASGTLSWFPSTGYEGNKRLGAVLLLMADEVDRLAGVVEGLIRQVR